MSSAIKIIVFRGCPSDESAKMPFLPFLVVVSWWQTWRKSKLWILSGARKKTFREHKKIPRFTVTTTASSKRICVVLYRMECGFKDITGWYEIRSFSLFFCSTCTIGFNLFSPEQVFRFIRVSGSVQWGLKSENSWWTLAFPFIFRVRPWFSESHNDLLVSTHVLQSFYRPPHSVDQR